MFLKKIKIPILFIILFSSVFSQIKQEKYKISGISVEGNNFIGPETIISLSGINVGDELNYPFDDKIQTAINNLWNRKQFSSIDVVIDRVTSSGVFLLIKVKENPRLGNIYFKGNNELSESELKKVITKNKGSIIDGYDIYFIKKDILKLYQDDGLYFATVDIESYDSDTSQYINLDIVIEEGNEFDISEIKFNGLKEFDDSDLKSVFEDTHEKNIWKFWQKSDYVADKYKKDLDLLNEFFKKEGFIDAAIIKDTVIYNDAEKDVQIVIDIEEGSRVYLRNIEFRGNTVFRSEALVERLEFKKGDVYNQVLFDMNLNLNQEQSDAKSMYNNSGYLFVEFIKNEKRIGSDSIDVIIDIFENDRAIVNKVNIIGNDKTKDKVIRRELFVRPGDYFSRSAIIRSVNALNALNYFNPENLRPDVKPVPGDKTKVDIEFNVEERSTDTFNASMGFAGTFGFTGSIGITFNNFSIEEPLKGGGGEILNFNYETGFQNLQRFSLGYTLPWLFDEPNTAGISLFDSRINFGFKFRRTGAALNFGRRFNWPDDYFRANWSLRVQENDIGTSGNSLYRTGQYTEIAIGQNISRLSFDNQFFATTGSRFSLQTDFALGALGIGATDYVKAELNYDVYNSILKIAEQDKLVLYLGTKLGIIEGINSDTTLSPIELYRMGGNALGGVNVTPLRGYGDRTIEPDGGKIMAKFTAELRFAISLNPMPIYVYAFAEGGQVWNDINKIDPFGLNRSAGVGLQMFVNPIGVIGFSYGYGFDPVGNSDQPFGWKFLINVGQF